MLTFFYCTGLSLGSLVGGVLFQSIGGANTFLAFAIMSWVGFILHVVAQYFVQKKQPAEWQQQQEEVKGLFLFHSDFSAG
jgi:predicted MFS family arabinose efflux permease